MDIYVVKVNGKDRIYEVAYDETDSNFHIVSLDDDFVRYQPFKTKDDLFASLNEFKALGIIDDYYKY